MFFSDTISPGSQDWLSEREEPEIRTDGHGLHLQLIIAFDILNGFAVLTLSIIFLTAWFSSRIRRVSTWYLYIFSWIVFSLGYILILGRQTRSMPSHGLCLFQSAMIYATPAFASTSIVVFVAQIFLDIRYALVLKFVNQNTIRKLIAIPWITFIAILLEVFTFVAIYPNLVERERSGMFCHTSYPLPRQITGAIVLISIIIMLILGILITKTLRQNRNHWQTYCINNVSHFQCYDTVFRLSLFLLAPVIASIILVVEFLPGLDNIAFSAVHVVEALLPATAALIVGSQKDILRVWFFWRSDKPVLECSSEQEVQSDCSSTETVVTIEKV